MNPKNLHLEEMADFGSGTSPAANSRDPEIESDYPRHVIEKGDSGYPMHLVEFPDSPSRLYVLGNPEALAVPGLAVIGARKATPYGEACAERFSILASALGITVISGGAIGCDQAAHRGALAGGGPTVVVLGSGANIAYPRRGKPVFEEVLAKGGAMVSELPWGSSPQRWAFKKRNRIIAGLAEAVLIVEAGIPSGTFSTADFALGAGRDVLVVPGSIFSKSSDGSNKLLREGAFPIVDDDSFLDEMARVFALGPAEAPDGLCGDPRSIARTGQLDAASTRILEMIAASPCTPDELSASCGMGITQVIKVLSSLETLGIASRYPDGRFGFDPRGSR